MNAAWATFRKRHWESRAQQERRAIVFAALVLAPVVIYFLLWQPARTALVKLHETLPVLRAQAAFMRTQMSEAEALRHRPQPAVLDAKSLKTAIEESATRHQLRETLASIEVQEPNSVRLAIMTIPFDRWVGWLRDLQQEQHIRADAVSISALAQTGMVKVNATLSNGIAQ
jgi:type II secretory pathway component PulM